jgi:hypothetical protein
MMSVMMFFMPETPYYLITKGKMEQAEKSLSWLRGKQYDTTKEMGELQATYQDQIKTGSVSIKQLLTEVSIQILKFFFLYTLLFFISFFSSFFLLLCQPARLPLVISFYVSTPFLFLFRLT